MAAEFTVKKAISYRALWMGLAILAVMLYHSGMEFGIPLVDGLKETGYGGVDIFIFASGIGNYYSYLRDKSPVAFMGRRVLRLAPVYIPFITVWCIYSLAKGYMSPLHVVGNLFGVQDMSAAGDSFNWYLSLIIICYILTPYLAELVSRKKMQLQLLLVLFLLVLSTVFFEDSRFIISAVRLPIYVMGMICAKYSECTVKSWMSVLCIISMISGYIILWLVKVHFPELLWEYGMYWYPFILIAPAWCLISSRLGSIFEKNVIIKPIITALAGIGKRSFELFLIHIFAFNNFRRYIKAHELEAKNWWWLIMMLVCILLACVLGIIADRIRERFKKV